MPMHIIMHNSQSSVKLESTEILEITFLGGLISSDSCHIDVARITDYPFNTAVELFSLLTKHWPAILT